MRPRTIERHKGTNIVTEALWLVVGVVVGAVAGGGVAMVVARRSAERSRSKVESAVEQLKTTFAALSHEALSKNTDEFLKLAKTRLEQQSGLGAEQLETKKKLIDATLVDMNQRLKELRDQTHSSDKERRESVGSIKTELVKTAEATGKLYETTSHLREALASAKRRGQWGERMAEDVLRLAGFVENVNYHKQTRTDGGKIPDFTFLLPRGLKLNADVKFPLDNYLRAIDTDDAGQQRQFQAAFMRDVRNHLKSVTTREYIDPEGGTVECVLVFIPNEQVYGYLHEIDRNLIDDSVKQRIVLCSPLTLYAVLSVIRQAVDNFRLELASRDILALLGGFQKEWGRFCETVDKMGRAIAQAGKQFDDLTGVRTRQLERQLDRIEALRQSSGLEESPPDGDDLRDSLRTD